ncbi:hypothetical protein ACSBR2_017296 [Camellia fascicularis]
MDFKHFSHPHNLSFHQIPQGTDAHCFGCNFPVVGTAFMCWQCQFFLHHQCFLATRSLNHPSHPSHPLSLLPSPTYPCGSFFCNSCNLPGTAFSYSCAHCEFDLHLHCASLPQPTTTTTHIPNQYAYTPEISTTHQSLLINNSPNPIMGPTPTHKKNPPQPQGVKHFTHNHPLNLTNIREVDLITCSGCEKKLSGLVYSCSQSNNCKFYLHQQCFGLPPEINHESHPNHSLTLLCSPPYKQDNAFTCNACLSNGSAFSYHCSACNFDLHVDCAFLPETVRNGNHNHPLTLFYSFPYNKTGYKEGEVIFGCDVCAKSVNIDYWFYYCTQCDYGTHLECVNAKASPKEELSEDLLAAALIEMQRLELRSTLNAINNAAVNINQFGSIG